MATHASPLELTEAASAFFDGPFEFERAEVRKGGSGASQFIARRVVRNLANFSGPPSRA